EVRHAGPSLQVTAAGGGEVRAEDVEAAVCDHHRGVVHGDVLEGRIGPMGGWRACLAARRGQGAHAGRREGGGRGDERAAGQGARIWSWRGGVPGRAPGRTAGAGPDVLEGPRARVGASTSR